MTMTPSTPASSRRMLWLFLGVGAGLAIAFLLRSFWPGASPPSARISKPPSTKRPDVPPIDREAARRHAWEKITPRLDAADKASAAAIDPAVEQLNTFFAQRQAGTREFAKAVLSLKGKWALIKSKLPFTDANEHFLFLHERFEECVFKPEDLEAATRSAIDSYVKAVEGHENQLLRDVRSDLSDLPAPDVIPALRTEAVFSKAYRKMLEQVAAKVLRSLGADAGREVAGYVTGAIAAAITTRVIAAVATRMGVTAGLVGAGATSSTVTFGVSLVAAIVVDIALDWLLNLAGYDPEGEVAAKVDGTLEHVRSLLVDGDPEALEIYVKLREMEKQDPVPEVRDHCKKAADRIDRGGHLGLRHALKRLQETRSRLRREALQRLILKGEPL